MCTSCRLPAWPSPGRSLPARPADDESDEKPARNRAGRLTGAMSSREPALEELSDAECRELLGAHEVGRLIVVLDGEPHVFPVNYAFDGEGIVVRTDHGAKLH